MKPELGTKPRVYYLNVPKKFIAGTNIKILDTYSDPVAVGGAGDEGDGQGESLQLDRAGGSAGQSGRGARADLLGRARPRLHAPRYRLLELARTAPTLTRTRRHRRSITNWFLLRSHPSAIGGG